MDYEKELIQYANTILENPTYKNDGEEWVFGAIDFAINARIIDEDTYCKLLKKYNYIE